MVHGLFARRDRRHHVTVSVWVGPVGCQDRPPCAKANGCPPQPAPRCPSPTIPQGALVCQPTTNAVQSCNLICHHGYQNTLPFSSFVCNTGSRQWDDQRRPVGGACQRKRPTVTPVAARISQRSWTLITARVCVCVCACSVSASTAALICPVVVFAVSLLSHQQSPVHVVTPDDQQRSLFCTGEFCSWINHTGSTIVAHCY